MGSSLFRGQLWQGQHSLLLAILLVAAGMVVAAPAPPPTNLPHENNATSVPTPKQRAAAAKQQVRQPLWLQELSKQPFSNSTHIGRNNTPATIRRDSSILAAPFIMLQRAPTIKHRHKISSSKAATVRISSPGIRAGTLYRVPLKTTGDKGSVTIKVPEGNEYVGIGIFAWDLGPKTNVDIALSSGEEVITESNNTAGMDDFLEAPDGLTAGEYTVTVTGVKVSQAIIVQVYVWMFSGQRRAVIATALPIQASPNPVHLTGAAGCCSVELGVGEVQLTNNPPSRYIGIIKYTTPDGKPFPGAARTLVYLL